MNDESNSGEDQADFIHQKASPPRAPRPRRKRKASLQRSPSRPRETN